MFLPNTTIRTRFSLCCAVGLLCVQGAAAAGGPDWGTSSNGLSIAVEVKNDKLLVFFRNTGAGYMRFAVGGRTGIGAMYSIEFTATAPDGRICKVDDLTVGGVGGYVSPIVIFLTPGATDRVSIELWNLRCTKDSGISLDQLLKKGYSVCATLNVTAESNAWDRVANGWTGKVTSGSFTMKNSGGL